MAREIRFRAWDSQAEQMVAWFQVAQVPFDDAIEQGAILMQYTGLKDKNGVEIYEGDICNVTKTSIIDNRHVAEVRWQTNVARVAFVIDYHNDDGKLFYGYHELNHESIEVIGNIYENSELQEQPA